MSVYVPTPTENLVAEELREAHRRGVPLPWLDRRHLPVRSGAQVLSLVGLTGDNVPVGFALGDVDADEPHTIVIVGEPRDPALAVRAAARLADLLDPLVAGHLAGTPVQLLVEGAGTLGFLHAWTWRLRSPWLPGPYASVPELVAARQRSVDAFALLRSLLASAEVPGADTVCAAVPALNEHLVFPLAGELEAQQLPVMLACLRRAGAPVTVPVPDRPELIHEIEEAEDLAAGAATRPEWDNKQLLPALSAFKRLRTRAARGNQLARIDRAAVAGAAATSGLDVCVRGALLVRHQMTAAAFRLLRDLPPLTTLDARAGRAAWRVNQILSRGAAHDPRWPDFPRVRTAARAAEDDATLTAAAVLDAVREDDRALAFAGSRGEATTARLAGPPSPDGRTVTLELPAPLAARQLEGWWWLDDPHDSPVIGTLTLHGSGPGPVRATWQITGQMTRVRTGALPTGPAELRLTCLTRPFPGRPWRPRADMPALAT